MEGNPAVSLSVCAVLLVVTGVLHAFHAAILSLSESTVEKRLESDPKKAKRLLKWMEDPSRLQIMIFLVTMILPMLAGMLIYQSLSMCLYWFIMGYAGEFIVAWLLSGVAYVITAIYLILLMAIFSFFVPKCLGTKYAESVAFGMLGFASLFMALCSFVVTFVQWISQVVLFIFGINLKEINEEVTEEEIKSMIDEGHEQGVLEEDEAEMISNIFEFGDKVARDIMTHRKNIVALDGELSLKEAMEFILDNNYSRYPVYEGDIDNIIGILHVKDAMIHYSQDHVEQESLLSLRSFLREPVFIPETRNINTLFKDMQSEKTHMEIIIDEYGQTAGLVAMEDILEEIVGNIFDEYDEEENNIVPCDDGTYLVKGMTHLDELEEELELSFESEDYDTLNGYLISKLDRILSENDLPEITIGRCHFDILAVENKLISLVRITVLEDMSEEEEEDDEDDKKSDKKSDRKSDK